MPSGAGHDSDAFLIAWTVPEMASTLLIEDAMALLMVPAFSHALARRAAARAGLTRKEARAQDPVRLLVGATPPRLVHGDFRMGNLIVDESGLAAVLDWELVHIGEIYEDLATRGVITPLDNAYFATLGFSNLRQNRTPSEHMSAREITLYRTLGMILFIIAGYASHPSRFWRTARNLVRSRQESAVEERLDQLIVQPLRRAFGRPARARATA